MSEEKCFTLTPLPAPKGDGVSITAEDQPNKTRQMLAFGALSAALPKMHLMKLKFIMCFPGWYTGAPCPAESLPNSARRNKERGERGWAEGQGRAQLARAAAGAVGSLSSGPQRRQRTALPLSGARPPARPRAAPGDRSPGPPPWRRSAARRGLSPSTNVSANALPTAPPARGPPGSPEAAAAAAHHGRDRAEPQPPPPRPGPPPTR